jgi:hypothetical protein
MISTRLCGLYKCNFVFVYMTKGDPYHADDSWEYQEGALGQWRPLSSCMSHNKSLDTIGEHVCGSYETWGLHQSLKKESFASWHCRLPELVNPNHKYFIQNGNKLERISISRWKNDNLVAIVVWRWGCLFRDGGWTCLGLINQQETAKLFRLLQTELIVSSAAIRIVSTVNNARRENSVHNCVVDRMTEELWFDSRQAHILHKDHTCYVDN